MKRIVLNRVLTGLTICMGLAGGVLVAQTPAKLGTISLQQAVLNTQEAKAASAKVQREFIEPRTNELKAKQQAIVDAQDKLQRGGNTLSQAAKDELNLDIQRKTKDFNRGVEDFEADQEDHQRELLADFSTKMQAVIEAYSRANGFAMIFDTSNRDQSGLVYFSSAIDITAAIIEAYDKAHPAAVSAPSPAPPPTAPPASPKPPATPAKSGTTK
jgi:outer membrane protein